MKKYALFLIILITIGCEKSDQFTSVEGYITDYYSKEPVPGIPLLITEYRPFLYPSVDTEDTVFSNSDGYYYYEFFNKEDRNYKIENLQTETYYSQKDASTIAEGKTNTINFAIKPFKSLTLNCYNQSKTFNRLRIYSHIDESEYIRNPCEEFETFDFNIVPEFENDFYIGLVHYNENNEADSTKGEHFIFYSGINDTTINYYY
ncbi:MAG: hypothetical protein K9H26_19175 [Prolixibacteraceae bacterium]|nr:hypothetical protein [Prolixibacteraceae bacterium]